MEKAKKEKKPYQKPSIENLSLLQAWGTSCCKDHACTAGAKSDSGKPASNSSAS